MTAPWEVRLEVAGYAWDVTSLDPATPGPTSPLTMRQALPEDQLYPAQPLPKAATFGLVAPDATALSDIVRGAPVWISVTFPPNPTPVTFEGNVSDVEIEPTKFTPDPDDPATVVDGVRISVVAIGYLAQLWEEPITLTESAGGDSVFMDDRLWNLFEGFLPSDNATPWPAPEGVWSSAPNYFPGELLKALDVQGESLGPHLDRLLRVWLFDLANDGTLTRQIVEPIVDPVTHELGSVVGAGPGKSYWQLVQVPNTVELQPIGDFADTPEGWGVVVDAGTIDAGKVERSIRFVQRNRTNVGKVVVPYLKLSDMKEHTTSADNGNRPAIQHTIESDLAVLNTTEETTVAKAVAAFYLPAGGADAWGVDTVTWLLHADTPGTLPPELGELVVIAPVPATQNPNGDAWATGLVRSWTLTLPDATVELELATARGIAAPGADRMTWDELPAGPTWADLRPDQTWDDLELVKGP